MDVSKSTPFSYKSAEEATGFLLWKTHNYWQREIKKCLKPFDLTHTQFVVLANAQWLVLHQDSVSQIDIAKHAQIDVMMTSNVIRTLEKKDFILRKTHQIDTRAKVISLSKSGLLVLTEAIKAVEAFDKVFFGQLEDEKSFNASLLQLLIYN
jgi:DNA-binding MarR family transcriptional regulator